jgi:methoxymalonate biosynthesis acyl carrier protein
MGGNARTHLHQFIRGRFPAAQLTDEQDIFSLGFVNSLFAMELVLFIEKQFGIRIPNEELDLANFRTVASMTGLVERLAVAA